jgi:hypothetical protein
MLQAFMRPKVLLCANRENLIDLVFCTVFFIFLLRTNGTNHCWAMVMVDLLSRFSLLSGLDPLNSSSAFSFVTYLVLFFPLFSFYI